MAKVNKDDTMYIIWNCKPIGSWYNKKAKKRATGLYRNDKAFVTPEPTRKKVILAPLKALRFLSGTSGERQMSETALKDGGQNMVRMLKSQEDSINTMGEEAASQAFQSSFLLIS